MKNNYYSDRNKVIRGNIGFMNSKCRAKLEKKKIKARIKEAKRQED